MHTGRVSCRYRDLVHGSELHTDHGDDHGERLLVIGHELLRSAKTGDPETIRPDLGRVDIHFKSIMHAAQATMEAKLRAVLS